MRYLEHVQAQLAAEPIELSDTELVRVRSIFGEVRP